MATEIERAIIELQVLFRKLDQRIASIEQGHPQPPPPTAPSTPRTTSTSQSTPPPSPPPPPPSYLPPQPPTPAPTPLKPASAPPTQTFTSPAAQAAAAAQQRLQSLFQQISDRPKPDDHLEKTIGQTVVSYVGGLVLLGGILFFLRNSFDLYWLHASTRVMAAAIAGLLLVATGQWLHAIRMRPLAAAVTATGLAAIMSAFFAGHITYQPYVLSQTTAYIGILITGLAGLGLAFQLRMQSLAILSLLGMYIAPLILSSRNSDSFSMIVYLSNITLLAMTITYFRRDWRFLRLLALLTLAVPFYFDSYTVSIAWSLLTLALAVYAFLTNSQLARITLFVTFCLLTLNILILDSANEELRIVLFNRAGIDFTHWMLRGGIVALQSLLLAWIVRPARFDAPANLLDNRAEFYSTIWAPTALAVVGSILWCVVAAAGLHSFHNITLAFLLWNFLLILLARILLNEEDAPFIETTSAILLTVITLKWALFDGLGPILNGAAPDNSLLPGFNLFLLNGLLILLAFRATRILHALGREFFAWLITILAFIALNVEALRTIDRLPAANIALLGETWFVKNVFISILWGLYAFGMVCVGFLRKYSPARWVALTLLALTVAKVLLIDMARVDTGLRVLSFLTIGALLLIISFLYHKSARPQPAST